MPIGEFVLSSKSKRWQTLAILFCVAFGLALILNTHPAGDGMWYWYAVLLRTHHRLYADLHLALQPLFVMETAAFQSLLGESWLASKVPAFLQSIAYCFGIALVIRFSRWGDWEKATIIVGVFALTIYIRFYRFDDYHITTDCFQIYSIYVLLRLHEHRTRTAILGFSVILGVLSGFALSNRLNDGAALLLGVVIGAVFLVRSYRVMSALVVIGAAVGTLLAVVLATGDTLHNWFAYSIVAAAAIKGGTGSVLRSPLLLPRAIYRGICGTPHIRRFLAGVPLIVALGTWTPKYTAAVSRTRRAVILVSAAALSLLVIKLLGPRSGLTVEVLTEFLVLVLYVLCAMVAGRAILQAGRSRDWHWDARELLLLIPFGQLLSGAMTSAQSLPDFYPAVAVALLLIPVASPIRVRSIIEKGMYLSIVALLGLSAIAYKIKTPYLWHYYSAAPLFRDREWYSHPEYGPMYIETEQLQFIQSVCSEIRNDSGAKELLSLPYPYGNYFCGIAPWGGYVQTWFDTSSKATIDEMIDRLQSSPPRWILYQRQLATMKIHEEVFFHSQPLPHRALDQLIMDRLKDGSWVAKEYPFQGVKWYLIRTAK